MEGLKPPPANSLDELGFRAASHTGVLTCEVDKLRAVQI